MRKRHGRQDWGTKYRNIARGDTRDDTGGKHRVASWEKHGPTRIELTKT